MFAAFRELHFSLRDQVGDDPGYEALCQFLKRWEPARAEELRDWADAAGMNVVFKLRGAQQYVHQSEPVRGVWLKYVNSTVTDESTMYGVSLVSGNQEPLARLHSLISGVAGANTTGAAIVSFNLDAFESYGKTQSHNSPVGIHDAFRYTTALNRLLSDERRRVRIGDATVVFWTDREDAKDAEDLFAALFVEEVPKDDAPAESSQMIDRLWAFLRRARQGRVEETLAAPQAPFYVLGLSPNASRLNVRFWLAGTVAQFVQRLAEHAAQLEIIGARDGDPPLLIRRLLLETARDPKDVPPQLAGELARAVLGGLPYPQILFSSIVRRIRADCTLTHRRAAILKAYLIRNLNQEVPMALDPNHPDEAYHLGRLFAALEKTQEDATDGKLNATIKDRFFGAGAATPATVFPRLLRLHQHHMNKVENPGLRINREKLIGEISGRVRQFPLHLSLQRQGLFYIGYYHQRQDFFTKKEKETTDE
jgi:CRISPR-associated protein Csd1